MELDLAPDSLVLTAGGQYHNLPFDGIESIRWETTPGQGRLVVAGAVPATLVPDNPEVARQFVAEAVARLQRPVAEDLRGYHPPAPPPATHHIAATPHPPPTPAAPAHEVPQPPLAFATTPPSDLASNLLARPRLLGHLVTGLLVAAMGTAAVGGLTVVLRSFDASDPTIESGERAATFLGGALLVVLIAWTLYLLAIAVRFVSAHRPDDPCATKPLLGPLQVALARTATIDRLALWMSVGIIVSAGVVAVIAAVAGTGSVILWLAIGLVGATTSLALGQVVMFVRATVARTLSHG